MKNNPKTWWGDKFLGVDSNGNDAAKVGAGGGVFKTSWRDGALRAALEPPFRMFFP